jgi:galactofuranosylgalactofuranosylrhamnosyl-N-acetylglucosaminyl-diphospho-decaprenol beta-1,5/1,6-galactofuranosyltransferase
MSDRVVTESPRNYVQRLPADRGVVQRMHFAGVDLRAPDDMYCLADVGVAVRERDRLVLDGHARITSNTYFGRFPASYWQRWTAVRSVRLDAVLTGTGIVRLIASDAFGQPRIVDAQRVEDAVAEPVQLASPLTQFLDGGALWVEFETAVGALTAERVRWSVDEAAQRRPTAVVICTFNRADDCLATLRTLASDREVVAGVDTVYVVDQGSDTVDSRPGFADVEASLGGVLRYIRQPNLGGAGGFTRGIFEALGRESADRVDLLLMDDDIRLEPDTVLRMQALADAAVHPTLIGGQMLKALHPNRLHVGAEEARLSILRAGAPVQGALFDVDVTQAHQEVRVDAAYNGWWACLIPSEVVAAIGYPLPVFFQWDDIEYGLRAGEAGFPTVTLPGAGVWHADFSWKNWDDWSRYFSFRNALIASALHSDFDLRSITEHLGRQLANYLVTMRYGLAATMLRAVEDFLRGPDALADGGVEAAAAVRRLRAEFPETVNRVPYELPGLGYTDTPQVAAAGTPSMPRAVLAKRVVWQLLRKRRGTAAISEKDSFWWHVSLFETAVVTDPGQEGVRVRTFDRELMSRLAREGARVLWRLTREGPRVRAEYQQRLPELTSRENWARLFGTE